MTIANRFAAVVGTFTAALLLAGCGSSSNGAAFQTQSGVAPDAAAQSCLVHQKASPTADYKGGTGGTTTDVLTFLAYYTANGNKKFCDGKPANAKDKAWGALYASFAQAKNVKGIIGS
jgi:hypothetical protein